MQTTDEKLIRGINRWDVVAIAINSLIGAGIFGLPAKVYALLGAYSWLAFIACGLVVSLIVVCFAEVSSRFSATGGPYLYAREAFGPLAAFEVGWLYWLVRVTAFATNCNLIVSYFSYFAPTMGTGWGRVTIISLVVAALTATNLAGIRNTAWAINIFTIGKLIPLLLFVSVGLFFLNPQQLALGAPPEMGNFSTAVLLLIYAFTGFEMAAIPAGELRHPQRDMPRALLTAIAIVAVLYILIQVVAVGTLPTLATSERPLADASRQFLGAAGVTIIVSGALISIYGNLNSILLAGSRLPFAMAEQGELPGVFARTHERWRTPHVSILLTALVMLALTVYSTFLEALTISTITRLLVYATTCAALPVLRRQTDAPPADFRVPLGVVVSVLSLALIAWLLYNVKGSEARTAAIAAGLGLLLYFINRLRRGKRFAQKEGNSTYS